MRRPAQVVALCLLLALAGCTTEDPTATTNIPTTPTNPTVDSFSGTVAVKSQDVKPFNILLSGGTVSIALTSVSQAGAVMGVGIGQWDGTTCSLFSNGTRSIGASAAPQMSFNQVPLGRYCVAVSDVGGQTDTVTYTLTVSHY